MKQAVTADDARKDDSVREWKTPRKEETAQKKFQDKESINLVGCDTAGG